MDAGSVFVVSLLVLFDFTRQRATFVIGSVLQSVALM